MGLLDKLLRRPSTARDFWSWFAAEAPRLRDLRNPAVLDDIGARLAKVDPELAFQLGQVDERCQLEISAEGVRAKIPAVEAFVAAAPPIDGWRVVAFRQPSPGVRVRMGDRQYSADSIHFVLHPGSPAELELYLAGYDAAPQQLRGLAFLLLDAAVGELAVMTRIGVIDFHDDSRRPTHARPLRDLAAELMN
jgi:hypothetical protein